MIVERHKLIGRLPVKRRVPKVTKIEPVRNGVDMDSSNTYDTVLAYCQRCYKRIDIPVVHDGATNTQFQLVSVPVTLSEKLDNYRAYCNNCGSTNIVEKQTKVTNFEVFTIKLDCSNMNEGTDSWYKNELSSSGDGHPRKF